MTQAGDAGPSGRGRAGQKLSPVSGLTTIGPQSTTNSVRHGYCFWKAFRDSFQLRQESTYLFDSKNYTWTSPIIRRIGTSWLADQRVASANGAVGAVHDTRKLLLMISQGVKTGENDGDHPTIARHDIFDGLCSVCPDCLGRTYTTSVVNLNTATPSSLRWQACSQRVSSTIMELPLN